MSDESVDNNLAIKHSKKDRLDEAKGEIGEQPMVNDRSDFHNRDAEGFSEKRLENLLYMRFGLENDQIQMFNLDDPGVQKELTTLFDLTEMAYSLETDYTVDDEKLHKALDYFVEANEKAEDFISRREMAVEDQLMSLVWEKGLEKLSNGLDAAYMLGENPIETDLNDFRELVRRNRSPSSATAKVRLDSKQSLRRGIVDGDRIKVLEKDIIRPLIAQKQLVELAEREGFSPVGMSEWLSSSWELNDYLVVNSTNDISEVQSPFNQERVVLKQWNREMLTPVFKTLTARLANDAAEGREVEVNRKSLERVFTALSNTEELDLAREWLVAEGLSLDQRRELAVGYINAVGTMSGVYLLSELAQDVALGEKVRGEFEMLYRMVQGDEGVNVLNNWEGVYEDYNYGEWVLASQGVTEVEIDKLQGWEEKYLAHVPEEERKRLDLASGVGRLILEQVKQGLGGDVYALEFQGGYVEQIKTSLLEMGMDQSRVDKLVKKGSWFSIVKDLGIEPGSLDVVECLGRSLSHNNKAVEWLRSFDQIAYSLREGGIAVIDQYIPDYGYSAEQRDVYLKNMREIGIKETVSLRIFDGILKENKFNRIVMTEEQLTALGTLYGMELVETDQEDISEHVKNGYFVFKKKEGFKPEDLSRMEIHQSLIDLGYFQELDNTKDAYVDSWGLTINQAIIFGLGHPEDEGAMGVENGWDEDVADWFGPDQLVRPVEPTLSHVEMIDFLRSANKEKIESGQPPLEVDIKVEGDRLWFEVGYSRDAGRHIMNLTDEQLREVFSGIEKSIRRVDLENTNPELYARWMRYINARTDALSRLRSKPRVRYLG